MEITEVRISLHEAKRLKGFANITLDNMFVIRGLKIVEGMNRYFIAMPSRRKHDGTYTDVAHPITHTFRKKMEAMVLDKYWEAVNTYSGIESLQSEFI